MKVLVKGVKQKVLPEPSDEWAAEASEFETLDALRDDLRAQVSRVRLAQARLATERPGDRGARRSRRRRRSPRLWSSPRSKSGFTIWLTGSRTAT